MSSEGLPVLVHTDGPWVHRSTAQQYSNRMYIPLQLSAAWYEYVALVLCCFFVGLTPLSLWLVACCQLPTFPLTRE